MPDFIQIKGEIYEKRSTEVFDFTFSCDREHKSNLLQHPGKFHPDQVECARKGSQHTLLCADLVIPSQGQSHRKWCGIIGVSGTCKCGVEL